MTAIPVPANPDVEAHVWAQIKHLEGVTMFAVTSAPAPGLPWLVTYTVQVDARARSKSSAWQRAEEARVLLWRLPEAAWAEGVVTLAQVTEGPAWLPDEDGQPRYMMRAEIGARPRVRSGPPPAVAATAPGRRVGKRTRS